MVKKTYEEIRDSYGNVIWERRTVVYDNSHERNRRNSYDCQHDWHDGSYSCTRTSIEEAYMDYLRSNEW